MSSLSSLEIKNPRLTMDQLESELDLPNRIESLERARALSIPLQIANAELNSVHVDATTPRYPDSVIQPYAPGEREHRDECLSRVHSLQAQALAWRLSDFFEGHPELLGFRYGQVKREPEDEPKSCLDRRFSFAIVKVELVDVGRGLLAPSALRETRAKNVIDQFFSAIPDLIFYHGADIALSRPTSGAGAIPALMGQLRERMKPSSYAFWEKGALGAEFGAKAIPSSPRVAL